VSRTTFALWDLETGNLVGAYDTEAAALAVVRSSIEQHGREAAIALALSKESHGHANSVATGLALVERATAALPVRRHRHAS
jgi:hypothetical protein